ncbi:RING finger domain-containing [Lecanosticta acicola]|uniref:RING finger domain-containing n=1 Tax=Lecanosticta acicola TaxID=111012 RepID=A0AAI8YSJ2_9PEZI|nr:RING finger domain-containing [Lecanosticta acicola]
MASLPARRPSQRRVSPTERPQTPSSQSQTSSIRSRSEDSQTIVVNRPEEEQQPQAEERGQQQEAEDDANLKKCWVCYCDSTEDTPESSPWRDPCPCALVAHEKCLLDWIADMEAPNKSRGGSIAAPKIECPQCKSEIKLARPRDYVVDAVRGLDRIGAKLVFHGAGAALGGMVYQASMAWGMHSIYTVFGAEDGWQVLRPLIYNAVRPPTEVYIGTPEGVGRQFLQVLIDHAAYWRLYIGVPLISPILIISQTSLADGVLPVLPVVFFASQVHSPNNALDFAQWPPSASFAFALLPYVRGLYNLGYKHLFAEREKRWLEELQPRANLDGGGDGNAGEGPNADQQEDGEFEVRIDGGIWDDWEGPAPAAQGAANAAQEQAGEDEAAPGPNVEDNRPLPNGGGNEAPVQQPQQPAQQQAGNQPIQRRLAFSPTAIAESVLGALLFPTIAGIAGEALKFVLPRSWTSLPAPTSTWRWNIKPASNRTFLSQKWARSLVGGCLFVVCKDALMLYVRWKMVQMHRNRRILDYDRRSARTAA